MILMIHGKPELFVSVLAQVILFSPASFSSRFYCLLDKLTIEFMVSTAACFFHAFKTMPLTHVLWVGISKQINISLH